MCTPVQWSGAQKSRRIPVRSYQEIQRYMHLTVRLFSVLHACFASKALKHGVLALGREEVHSFPAQDGHGGDCRAEARELSCD